MTSPALIAEARRALAAADPVLARVDAATPVFEWRSGIAGYAALIRVVVGQQVSTASAAAIWMRMEAGLGEITAAAVLTRDLDQLKALGLSTPKARYALAIAEAAVDFDALDRLGDEEAVAHLMALKGVGRWTAEAYLMFHHGRLDFFPVADVALQEALRMAEGASARLSQADLAERSQAWRPWRGVAAHLLWRFYAAMKSREILWT